MDQIVTWAKAENQAIRGHTLLWHRPQWFPEWLNTYDFGANPATEAERLLTSHIRTVTDRYQGVITSHDVVNEAIDHDTNGLMQTSLSRAMGWCRAVLDLAFHTAREQLPTGQLVYNDYPRLGAAARQAPRRRAPSARGLPQAQRAGRRAWHPVAHRDRSRSIRRRASAVPGARMAPVLDEAVAMGYKLLITEFDVKDKALPSDIAKRDAGVADFARRYFDVMLDYDELGDILAWGMIDKFSWLLGFARRDRTGSRSAAARTTRAARPSRCATAIAEAFTAA